MYVILNATYQCTDLLGFKFILCFTKIVPQQN